MKLSVKKILSCTALVFFAYSVFAVETGGLIINETKFANEEKDGSLKLDQKNGINLWLRAPVSEDGESYLAAEGSFKYEYDASIEDTDQRLSLYGDVNLFKLVIKKELSSGDFTFSAGRFYNSDLTSTIFTQNADGFKIDTSLSSFQLSLYAAYTGLLNAKNVTMLGDNTDLTDKEKTLYVMADKFAVGALTISLPYIFASQTVSLEGFGAISLESEKVNRFYGTLALNGPIVSPVFYTVSSTLGFTKAEDVDMVKGNLTKASIAVYPEYKSMSVSLNALYASGNQGSFEGFYGFTSGTAVNSLSEPEYNGVVLVGLSASIKPLSNLLFFANGDVVFDAAAGDKGEKIEQAGFQYSAGINWQALSDVSLGVNFAQYIGKEDYEATIGASKTQLKITAAIAF